MPYREKTAWLSLVAMATALVPYFSIVGAGTFPNEALPNLPQLGLFAVASVVQMLILGGGHLYLHRGSPKEARTPPDERDRAIMRRSISSASCSYHWDDPGGLRHAIQLKRLGYHQYGDIHDRCCGSRSLRRSRDELP